MNWREWDKNTDQKTLLNISREPMQGAVSLRWGLTELRCPPECNNLRGYAIETKGEITGSAMTWDWPDGSRYLSGLRFSQKMPTRPTPSFWKHAFTSILEGVDYAWTSIGADNKLARQILESNLSCLPRYHSRQEITTWFIPLSKKQREATGSMSLNQDLQLIPAHWRYVAIASGSGFFYHVGRLLNQLGRPGIPKPESKIRIAYVHPSESSKSFSLRQACRQAQGFDGLVIVLPQNSELAERWTEVAPRASWNWKSTLYSVSWKRDRTAPPIPNWKGAWL